MGIVGTVPAGRLEIFREYLRHIYHMTRKDSENTTISMGETVWVKDIITT